MGSQKKHHGGGIPGSLSGGIVHNSSEVTKTTFSVSVATCPSVLLSLGLCLSPQPGRARVRARKRREQSVVLSVLCSSWICLVEEMKVGLLGFSAPKCKAARKQHLAFGAL